MIIRRAALADLPGIKDCARAAYQVYVARIGREPAPMIADFAAQIAEGIVDVCVVENGICGFIIHYQRGDHVHLENVAVSPYCQGHGHGRALIAHVEAAACRAGAAAVELYTNAKMTENLGLYPRLGYVEIDRRNEDGFDRVFFRKPL